MKEIGGQIGDRDNSVRSAALNTLVQIYLLIGDDIYKYVGKVSTFVTFWLPQASFNCYCWSMFCLEDVFILLAWKAIGGYYDSKFLLFVCVCSSLVRFLLFGSLLKSWSLISHRFCEILAQNYAPGAAALRAWIIWGNILSSICSRSIIYTYTAPGAYLDMLLEHWAFYICSWSIFSICSGSIVPSSMLMEHIWLRIP